MVTDTIRARLKVRACWHCGSKNTGDWYDNEGVHTAGCKDCGQESGFEEWNVRAIEYGQSVLIEQLVEALISESKTFVDTGKTDLALCAYKQWKDS
jgi:hypothetical protein